MSRGGPTLQPAAERDPPNTLGAALRLRLVGFVRLLRAHRYAIGLAETRAGLAVLASPAAMRADLLGAALRAVFCATHSDWERFEGLFRAYWLGHGMRRLQPVRTTSAKGKPSLQRLAEAGSLPRDVAGNAKRAAQDADEEVVEQPGARTHASDAEALAEKDIRTIADPDELAALHALAARLARAMRVRLVRRARTRRRGRRLDLRRTIRRSISHGGMPIDLAWRRRNHKPPRLVVLLDASGSMNPYTAFFVLFLHGLIGAFRECEAFVFHTRLVHVSPSLRDRDAARAVDRMALMAHGIGGGTRIGESLADFNRWHAPRAINSRTVTLIVSDGYDTGDAERLVAEMRRLRRRCRRIVWLNPLIERRGYSPEARGMQAALPFIDLFAPAHNLASFAALEPYLAKV